MASIEAEENSDIMLEQSLLDDNDRNDCEEEKFDEVTFLGELKELGVLSLPVALSTLCRLVIINTDTAFVGHLGAKYLTSSSFGSTWNQFLSNIVFAPGYALNSLCSQAIGAGNLKLAGVWLQLAIVATTLICIPVLIGYLFTEEVVSLMIKEDDVPQLAQQFNYVSMLILWPMVMYMIIRQFFQAMQIVKPAMVVSFLTVGFNYLMNYLLVPEDSVFHWGLKGSPFATFISMIFQLACFLSYCVVYKKYHKPYWGGWSLEFAEPTRIKRFFQMVLPMAVGIVMENSGLQVISFSTGKIGENNIAALAILNSLWGVLWAFYWGAGLAMQVRIGSYLGKGDKNGAKLVLKISMVLVVTICTLVGLAAFVFRTEIAKLFTKDHDVIVVVEESMYALALDYFTACMALCAVNALEAMAANRILAFTLSFGMWAVQVPFSLLLAYNDRFGFAENHPVEGIWMGQVFGELFKIAVLWGYLLFFLDWDVVCKEARERSEATKNVTEEDSLLEHRLEEQDEEFDQERQNILQFRDEVHDAEALHDSLLANSPSPFIGTRSPKVGLRQVD